jgi:hypothetical protein
MMMKYLPTKTLLEDPNIFFAIFNRMILELEGEACGKLKDRKMTTTDRFSISQLNTLCFQLCNNNFPFYFFHQKLPKENIVR